MTSEPPLLALYERNSSMTGGFPKVQWCRKRFHAMTSPYALYTPLKAMKFKRVSKCDSYSMFFYRHANWGSLNYSRVISRPAHHISFLMVCIHFTVVKPKYKGHKTVMSNNKSFDVSQNLMFMYILTTMKRCVSVCVCVKYSPPLSGSWPICFRQNEQQKYSLVQEWLGTNFMSIRTNIFVSMIFFIVLFKHLFFNSKNIYSVSYNQPIKYHGKDRCANRQMRGNVAIFKTMYQLPHIN